MNAQTTLAPHAFRGSRHLPFRHQTLRRTIGDPVPVQQYMLQCRLQHLPGRGYRRHKPLDALGRAAQLDQPTTESWALDVDLISLGGRRYVLELTINPDSRAVERYRLIPLDEWDPLLAVRAA